MREALVASRDLPEWFEKTTSLYHLVLQFESPLFEYPMHCISVIAVHLLYVLMASDILYVVVVKFQSISTFFTRNQIDHIEGSVTQCRSRHYAESLVSEVILMMQCRLILQLPSGKVCHCRVESFLSRGGQDATTSAHIARSQEKCLIRWRRISWEHNVRL